MLKKSLSVFLRCVFANVMCLIIILIVSTITNRVFTSGIGYRAYGTKDNSQTSEFLYDYKYSSGEDTKQAEYEAQGYTVSTVEYRTELKGIGKAVNIILTQLLSTALLFFFLHGLLFDYGHSDSNAAHFGHITADKLYGLKIGLLSIVPFFAFYMVFAACGLGLYKNFSVVLYKLINSSSFGFYRLIMGDALKSGELGTVKILLSVLPLFVVPVLTHISYTLGFKGIVLGEKLVYKKKGEK